MVFTDAVLDVWREASNQCADVPRTGLPSDGLSYLRVLATLPHIRGG